MEDVFYILLGLAVFFLPLIMLVTTMRKTRFLEREVWDLRKRLSALERNVEQTSLQGGISAGQVSSLANPSGASHTIQPHQLATLIDLETLKQETASEASSFDAARDTTHAAPPPIPVPPTLAPKGTTNDSKTQPSTEAPKAPVKPHSVKPPRTNTEWEALIGGRLFNRIGAAAIVIGIGFFLKYAFDNDIISEPLRILIGVLLGAAFIGGAERMQRKKLPIFAQGLTGAGIGTLYLSVYAAYNFYHLMPVVQAFAGMIGVTVIGFVLALRYDALSIALLAWFGGYLTPLLIHSEQPNPFGLMSYLTILSLGMLALVLRRDDWFVLKPLSFIATYGVCGIWYANAYTTLEHFWMTLGFALLFWIMFFTVDLYRAASGRSTSDAPWRRIDSFLNSSISYAAFFAIIYDAHPRWMPVFSLFYGTSYFLASQLVRVQQPEHRFAFMRYTLTAIIQMIVATSQLLDKEWTIIAWSVEFAFLFWAGIRWRYTFVSLSGTVLSLVVFFFLLFWQTLHNMISPFQALLQSQKEPTLLSLVDLPLLMYTVGMVAFIAVGALFPRLVKQDERVGKLRIVNVFHFAWVIVGANAIIYKFSHIFLLEQSYSALYPIVHGEYRQFQIMGIAFTIFVVILAWLGRKLSWKEVTWMALLIGVLTFGMLILRGFVYEPAIEWTFLLNHRVVALLVAFGATLGLWKIFDKTNSTLPAIFAPSIRPVVGGIALMLLFTVLTGEASDYFHSQVMRLYALPAAVQQNATIGEKITALEYAQQLAISTVWLLYAAAMMIGGFVRRVRALRLVALGLAGVSVLKIFLYDLSFLTTPYRIGSFIGLGVVLLLVSYLYQRFKDRLLDDAA